jgi:hypothetical protein
MARRIAAVLGVLVIGLAFSIHGQQGPTILAVTLEVQPTAVRILSTAVVRGAISDSGTVAPGALRGTSNDLLIEYVYRTAGAGGKVIRTGIVRARLRPIVEPPPYVAGTPGPTPSTTVTTKRVVLVGVPQVSGATEMSFARITPTPGVPPDAWKRTPLGQAPVPPPNTGRGK